MWGVAVKAASRALVAVGPVGSAAVPVVAAAVPADGRAGEFGGSVIPTAATQADAAAVHLG